MEQQPRRVHSAQRYDVVITTPYHYLGGMERFDVFLLPDTPRRLLFKASNEIGDSHTLYLETGRCWKNHAFNRDPLTEEEIELAKAMMVCFGGTDA